MIEFCGGIVPAPTEICQLIKFAMAKVWREANTNEAEESNAHKEQRATTTQIGVAGVGD
jgi:hypothetical protein